MNSLISQTTQMLSLLPEDEVSLINALVHKLVLAWDPDFTKVTPEEKMALDEADEEMKAGHYFSDEDVW